MDRPIQELSGFRPEMRPAIFQLMRETQLKERIADDPQAAADHAQLINSQLKR